MQDFSGPLGRRVLGGYLLLWALCTAYLGFRGAIDALPNTPDLIAHFG